MKIAEEQVIEDDYNVIFTGLSISFIDTKGNVHFRADDYKIVKTTTAEHSPTFRSMFADSFNNLSTFASVFESTQCKLSIL